MDLSGEDSERCENLFELNASKLLATLVKGERKGSEGNTLLLLELHSKIADDAVAFDVEADAEKVRHFTLI